MGAGRRIGVVVFLGWMAAIGPSLTHAELALIRMSRDPEACGLHGAIAFWRGVAADGRRAIGTCFASVNGQSVQHGWVWERTIGFFWKPGIPAPCDPARADDLLGISPDGEHLVGECSAVLPGSGGFVVPRLFRWDPLHGSRIIDAPIGISAWAKTPVSAQGESIVGLTATAIGPAYATAATWSEDAGVVDASAAAGVDAGEAVAVSSSGRSVLLVHRGGLFGEPSRGWRWDRTTGGVDPIPFVDPLFGSSPVSLSFDGSSVVGSVFSNRWIRAFRWSTTSALVILGTGERNSYAESVSANGLIVAGRNVTPTGGLTQLVEAVLWDPQNGERRLRDVLTSGGVEIGGDALESIAFVSADGSTLLGRSSVPGGGVEAWAVVPEPRSVAGLAAGVATIARLAARRRRRSDDLAISPQAGE